MCKDFSDSESKVGIFVIFPQYSPLFSCLTGRNRSVIKGHLVTGSYRESNLWLFETRATEKPSKRVCVKIKKTFYKLHGLYVTLVDPVDFLTFYNTNYLDQMFKITFEEIV